jgi:hypothetical protein
MFISGFSNLFDNWVRQEIHIIPLKVLPVCK